MKKTRPQTVTVLAILNIIFGSLGLLCSICLGLAAFLLFGVVMNDPKVAQQMLEPKMFFESLQKHVPGVEIYYGSLLIYNLVAAVLLIISGILLLGMNPWGRRLAIFYSVVVIIAQFAALGFELTVVKGKLDLVQKDMKKFADDHNKMPGDVIFAQEPAGGEASETIETAITTLFSLAYPIVLLVFMFNPKIVRAFSEKQDSYSDLIDQDRDDFGFDRSGPHEERGY